MLEMLHAHVYLIEGLCRIYNAMYNTQCTIHNVQYTMQNAQCTMHNVQYIIMQSIHVLNYDT